VQTWDNWVGYLYSDVKAFSDSQTDISKIVVALTTHGASSPARKEAGFATLEKPAEI
jgi:hypothetical protein